MSDAGVQEEADRGAAAGRAAAEAAAAGAGVPGVAAAAAAGVATAAAAGQEAAVSLQRPGTRKQRQTRLGQRGELKHFSEVTFRLLQEIRKSFSLMTAQPRPDKIPAGRKISSLQVTSSCQKLV